MRWYRKIGVIIALGLIIAVVIVITVKNKECSEVTAANPKETKQIVEIIPEQYEFDFEELAASVVKLEVFNENGDRIGTGSGFAAYDESILITARHVIVNMDYMTATRDDGTTFRIDRTIETDDKSDIAICALPEDAKLVPLKFAEELPNRGTDTSVISSQFGISNLVTKGNICGYWETNESTWIMFTAPVSGGSSGGPLFNEDGQVVGIVSGTYEKGQNLNIAATSKAAIDLCKSLFE